MWSSYHETGSIGDDTIQFHITRFATRRAAEHHASEMSRQTGSFVGVMRKGLEVASYLRGAKVTGQK